MEIVFLMLVIGLGIALRNASRSYRFPLFLTPEQSAANRARTLELHAQRSPYWKGVLTKADFIRGHNGEEYARLTVRSHDGRVRTMTVWGDDKLAVVRSIPVNGKISALVETLTKTVNGTWTDDFVCDAVFHGR